MSCESKKVAYVRMASVALQKRRTLDTAEERERWL